MPLKRKISVSIDSSLLKFVDKVGRNRSEIVNEALAEWRKQRILIKLSEVYLRRGHKAFGDTKKRPCIVVSLNSQNQVSRSIIVVPCSTDLSYFVPHVRVKLVKGEGGLECDSMALCDRLAAIPKTYIIPEPLGIISSLSFEKIQYAIAASVGLIL